MSNLLLKSTLPFLTIGSTTLLPYFLLSSDNSRGSDHLNLNHSPSKFDIGGSKFEIVSQLNRNSAGKVNQTTDTLKGQKNILSGEFNYTPRGNVYSWLSTLGFKTEDIYSNLPLTIIVKWDDWAFRVVQLDRDCNCFKQLNLDIGIWINSLGKFTIANSSFFNHSVGKDLGENCTNFSSFWTQEWNTWWRISRWIKDFSGKGSCFRYPLLVFMDERKVPYFGKEIDFKQALASKSKIGTSRHVYWDTTLQEFSGDFYDRRGFKNIQIENYEDYSRLFELYEN